MLRSLNITQIYLLLKNQYSMHESIMLHKVSYDENYYSQARTILYSTNFRKAVWSKVHI